MPWLGRCRNEFGGERSRNGGVVQGFRYGCTYEYLALVRLRPHRGCTGSLSTIPLRRTEGTPPEQTSMQVVICSHLCEPQDSTTQVETQLLSWLLFSSPLASLSPSWSQSPTPSSLRPVAFLPVHNDSPYPYHSTHPPSLFLIFLSGQCVLYHHGCTIENQ